MTDSHPKGQSDAARANEPLSGWTNSDRLAVASPASINALHDNLHPVRRRPARVEIQASLGPSAASGRIHFPKLPQVSTHWNRCYRTQRIDWQWDMRSQEQFKSFQIHLPDQLSNSLAGYSGVMGLC